MTRLSARLCETANSYASPADRPLAKRELSLTDLKEAIVAASYVAVAKETL